MKDAQKKHGWWSWWYLLFVVEFAVTLWPSLYNKVDPSWLGIPFFYWSQLALVVVAAIFNAIVYFAMED
jgi:hypothetical protein